MISDPVIIVTCDKCGYMGLVELRDTETDFEREEYGETVWELTAEANNLRITKEK